MVESTNELEVDVSTRSGTQNRTEYERVRLPKKLCNEIREDERLGPDDPIHQPIKDRLRKGLDGSAILLDPTDRKDWIRYLNGVKMPDSIATPTAFERVSKLNLLNPHAYETARIAIEGASDIELNPVKIECPDFILGETGPVCMRRYPNMRKLPKDSIILNEDCKRCGGEERHLAQEREKKYERERALIKLREDDSELWDELSNNPAIERRIEVEPEFLSLAENWYGYPDFRSASDFERCLHTAEYVPINWTHILKCNFSGVEFADVKDYEDEIPCAKSCKGEITVWECFEFCYDLELIRNTKPLPDGLKMNAWIIDRIDHGQPLKWVNPSDVDEVDMEGGSIEAEA